MPVKVTATVSFTLCESDGRHGSRKPGKMSDAQLKAWLKDHIEQEHCDLGEYGSCVVIELKQEEIPGG